MNTVVQPNALQSANSGGASWGGTLMQCARAAAALCIVTGIVYPLLTTVIAKGVFPHQAEGSLIVKNGQLIGSSLIGQNFTGAGYFQGRPSVTTAPDPKDATATISAPYNPLPAAASNQGATSQSLETATIERANAYRALNGLGAQERVPVDAITASASGLDPHISVANATLQTERVAKARGLSSQQVSDLVAAHTASRDLWLLGEPRVNVLELNLALDALNAANNNQKKE